MLAENNSPRPPTAWVMPRDTRLCSAAQTPLGSFWGVSCGLTPQPIAFIWINQPSHAAAPCLWWRSHSRGAGSSPQHPEAAPPAAKIRGSAGTPHATQDNSHWQPPAPPRLPERRRLPWGPHVPSRGPIPSAADPAMLKLSHRFLCASQAFLLCKRAQTDISAANWGNQDLSRRKEPLFLCRGAERVGTAAQGDPVRGLGDSTGQPPRGAGYVIPWRHVERRKKSLRHVLAPAHSWFRMFWLNPAHPASALGLGEQTGSPQSWERPFEWAWGSHRPSWHRRCRDRVSFPPPPSTHRPRPRWGMSCQLGSAREAGRLLLQRRTLPCHTSARCELTGPGDAGSGSRGA